MARDVSPDQSRTSCLGGRLTDLFALSGLAVAQPLLDIVGKSPGLFVTHDTTAVELLALVCVVLLVPPFVLFAFEQLLALLLHHRGENAIHIFACGAVAAVFGEEVIRHNTQYGRVSVVAAGVAAGAAFAFFLGKSKQVRQFVRFLAIGPGLFAALFLGMSPAADVVFGHGASGIASEVRTPKRIVFIVLDELPLVSLLDGTGAIDAELYPNFAGLADTSTWYRNSRTVAAFTDGAVPAILTGRYPKRRDFEPIATSYPDNLFSMLADDYDLNVHEAVTRLCPAPSCATNAEGGFVSLVTKAASLWREFASPSIRKKTFDNADAWKVVEPNLERFVNSLEVAAEGDKPRLDFLHLEMPHYPWHYLPTGQKHRYVPGDPPGEAYLELWQSVPGTEAARQRHLLQVQATDLMLGTILDRLRAINAFEDSLVVVTADHGVSFTLGEPARNPSAKNLPDVLWTPLLIKYPGQSSGVVDDRRAESIDVLPTVAEAIDAEVPVKIDGKTLLGPAQLDGLRRVYPWVWFPTVRDLVAAPGRAFVEFDGAAGFADVLTRTVVARHGDADLRVYRRGPYADLLGRMVAEFDFGPSSAAVATFDNIDLFDDIDPKATVVDWAWNIGSISSVELETQIAIAADGRIVALTAAQLPNDDLAPFTFVVPPHLLEPGGVEIEVLLLSGPPTAPILSPVSLSRD